MENILVVIIIAAALAGFVRKVYVIYRDGDCGCGCNVCSQANGCSGIERKR